MATSVDDPDLHAVIERQKVRYQLLRALWRCTGGHTLRSARWFELAREQGVARGDADLAMRYLVDEGLINLAGAGGGVFIAHGGVVEVEHAVRFPDRETEHFMVQVIQHFHAAVGAVQNAPSSTAVVSADVRGENDGEG